MSTTSPPDESPPPRRTGKGRPSIDGDALRAWVKANPTATQRQAAEHFKCAGSTVRKHMPGHVWPTEPWQPGGPSPNAGGKPRLLPVVVDKLRSLTPKALRRLEKNIASKNGIVSNQAIKTALTAAWGKDMGARIPIDDAGVDALTAVQQLKALEQKLIAMALDGNERALFMALKAAAPEKYGDDAGDGGGDKKPSKRINFVRDGQQRPGHTPEEQDDAVDADGDV